VIANPIGHLTLNLKATVFRKSGPSTTMMEQLFGCPLGRPNPSIPGIQPASQFQDCNVNKVVGPEAIEPAVTVSEFSYLPLIGQWGGRHLDIAITAGANCSSAFNPDPAQDPLARKAGYVLINSELRLATHDDKYEVALIGRRGSTVRQVWVRQPAHDLGVAFSREVLI
jgi:hypothetical protein